MKPMLFFLPLLALCSGCTTMRLYAGTGSLQTSQTETVLRAYHAPAFAYCPGDPEASPPAEPFSVFSLGAECTVDGWEYPASLNPDPGSVCTFPFAEGPRTLRVTDVAKRWAYGHGTPSLVIRIGGDDAATGEHLFYSFVGQETGSASAVELCDRERPRHKRALALR